MPNQPSAPSLQPEASSATGASTDTYTAADLSNTLQFAGTASAAGDPLAGPISGSPTPSSAPGPDAATVVTTATCGPLASAPLSAPGTVVTASLPLPQPTLLAPAAAATGLSSGPALSSYLAPQTVSLGTMIQDTHAKSKDLLQQVLPGPQAPTTALGAPAALAKEASGAGVGPRRGGVEKASKGGKGAVQRG